MLPSVAKSIFKCDRSIWPLAVLHYLKNALTGAKFGGLPAPAATRICQTTKRLIRQFEFSNEWEMPHSPGKNIIYHVFNVFAGKY
jgi:hypothetical protein